MKIVSDSEEGELYLSRLYIKQIEKLNKQLQNNSYPDSGFDLYIPKDYEFLFTEQTSQTKKVDLQIQCAMYDANGMPSAFYIYPRSSISKTPFRFSNNTGIVDSGYRGNLGAYFDCFSNSTQKISKGTRLLQICSPNLKPFRVVLVNNLDETIRGAGGFGSTGK